jgi:hypothetical protein
VAVVAAGFASGQSPTSPGGGDQPSATGRVAHIRVIGDLDNSKVARDVGAELERAAREKAGLIVLELEAARSRPDVVWEIGRAVRESAVSVAAYLHEGPDGRLGAGALEVGLLATECHVRKKMTVRDGPEDDRRWTAPPEVGWERVERELTGALWVALKERGADQVLGTLLVARRPSAWCVPEGAGVRIAVSEPALGAGACARQIVFPAETGGVGRVELSAEDLAGLGAVRLGAESVAQVAAANGRGLASRSSRTLQSDLEGARNRAGEAVEGARAATRRAEEALDVRRRARRRTATSLDYHEAARDAQVEIDRAVAQLKSAGEEIAAYPELARLKPDPPGAPKRRSKPESPLLAGISELESAVEKLRVRAEGYAHKK